MLIWLGTPQAAGIRAQVGYRCKGRKKRQISSGAHKHIHYWYTAVRACWVGEGRQCGR